MSIDDSLAQAQTAVREGQQLEASGALPPAVQRYEAALAILRTLPIADDRVRHAFALTSMNRGNALQKQNTAETLDLAIHAYDEGIVFLRTLPLDPNPDYRNSLGAAWMNRGHAQLALGDPTSLVESVHSQRQAVAVLRTLPLDAHRSFRVNLAAALMNEANALVMLAEPAQAGERARESMAVTAPAEQTDSILAELGLKARRVRCEAISQLLALANQHGGSTDALGDEASDLVDEGLSLARHWEAQGHAEFRSISARLFRFGAQLYAVALPDFLAEFVLEHLDPERSAGAMAETEEFYLIASQVLTGVRQELENRRAIFLDNPETLRLVQRLRDIRAAEVRLKELRARHLVRKS